MWSTGAAVDTGIPFILLMCSAIHKDATRLETSQVSGHPQDSATIHAHTCDSKIHKKKSNYQSQKQHPTEKEDIIYRQKASIVQP